MAKSNPKLFYPVKLTVLNMLPLVDTHAKDLYLCLCAHANFKTGECWPSYRRIMAKTKIGKHTRIKKAIDKLVELGLITTWLEGQNRHYKVL